MPTTRPSDDLAAPAHAPAEPADTAAPAGPTEDATLVVPAQAAAPAEPDPLVTMNRFLDHLSCLGPDDPLAQDLRKFRDAGAFRVDASELDVLQEVLLTQADGPDGLAAFRRAWTASLPLQGKIFGVKYAHPPSMATNFSRHLIEQVHAVRLEHDPRTKGKGWWKFGHNFHGFLAPDAKLICHCRTGWEGHHILWTVHIKSLIREADLDAQVSRAKLLDPDAWREAETLRDADRKTALGIAQAIALARNGSGKHHIVLVGTRFCRLFVHDNGSMSVELRDADDGQNEEMADEEDETGIYSQLPHALLTDDGEVDMHAVQVYKNHAAHAALAHALYRRARLSQGLVEQLDRVDPPGDFDDTALSRLWPALDEKHTAVKS